MARRTKITFKDKYGNNSFLTITKPSPIHTDYCTDCGCPKDICCKRVGAKEELEWLLEKSIWVSEVILDLKQMPTLRQHIRQRIMELV
jgi:hypothetical protein